MEKPNADGSQENVAPFAGAWIEISDRTRTGRSVEVAPFAGAWIEIFGDVKMKEDASGRSLRGSVD